MENDGSDDFLVFDPLGPEVFVNGVDFDRLAQIRAAGPLCKTPAGDWYVASHEHIDEVLKQVEVFRADLSVMSGLSSLDEVPDEQLFLSEITEPRHGKIRRLYNAAFAPHRVRFLTDAVRDLIGGLADRMVSGGEGDLHHDYAAYIPSAVMAHAMGLDDEAAQSFMRWSLDGSIMSRPASPQNADGGPAIQDFFLECVAGRRAGNRDAVGSGGERDLIANLMEAEIDGVPLTDREIVTQLHFMIQAGVHTTRGLLSHALQRLLFDPALYASLDADRELIGPYVEESLRVDSPVQRTTRVAMVDYELGGCPIQAGESVQVGIGSGNRDEGVFDDGERFVVGRADGKAHLAFGAGSHICPGATLARLEATTCIAELLDRVESMAPIDGHEYPHLPGNLVHDPIPARFVLR